MVYLNDVRKMLKIFSFFKFHEQFMHETFLIFCLKLQQHKGSKLGKVILSKFHF